MTRTRIRIAQTTTAIVVLATAIYAPPASADATLKAPSPNAACIAQAWVPYNTDPEVAAGALGEYLSTNPPTNGSLSQNQYDCRP
jgi:hypothetical protein